MPEPEKPAPPERGPATAARLTRQEVVYALYFAARDPEALLVASRRLKPEFFLIPAEIDLLLFWQGVLRAAGEGGVLPRDPAAAGPRVGTACTAELALDPSGSYYTPEVVTRVLGPAGLVVEAFHRFVPAPESRRDDFALLGRLLVERGLSDPLRLALLNLQGHETLVDPLAVLKSFEERWATVAPAESGRLAISGDPTARPALPDLVTTGQPWLDLLMNGGQAAGEAYCLLGVTGSGKSSLAVQLAVDGACEQARASSCGARSGYWHYFSWELSYDELMQRVYSYGARVHADTYRNHTPFSDASRLKDYERDGVVNPAGVPPLGEAERLAAFARAHGGEASRLVVHDYCGDVRGQGRGGIGEAIDALRRAAHSGRPPAGVVLDYAGICEERMVSASAGRLRPGDVFTLLGSYMDRARFELAKPFACPVWVLHQFHGDQSGLAPGVAIHHKHARGSRNIGDNADFAFGIGNRDMRTNLVTFSMTKHRRAPGRNEPQILHFDGRFNTFRTPAGSYAVDPTTRRIVDAAEAAALEAGPPPPDEPPPDLAAAL